MRNFNENTITAAVLDRVKNASSPRARQVSEALVRHLHAFVREIRPTQKEWECGIDFLTRTGQMCDDKRQEFILLSDSLGVSMLVDAINHPVAEGATESTVLGPFYVEAAPEKSIGDDISGGMDGNPLLVSGTISSADGKPIGGASIEVWHSDNDGFMISAPGYEQLVTHVFVAGDQYLDSDAVFGVKDSLIREYLRHPGGRAPDGRVLDVPYYQLQCDFGLKRASPEAIA